MAKKDSSQLSAKLKAIEVIVKELQKLGEEDRRDVVSFALKQVGITDGVPAPAEQTGGETSGSGAIGANLNSGIDKFASAKKSRDQYQRVAVLAYYLKHKDNVSEFKNREMAAANLKARQSKIANIADTISKARNRYGFLTKGIAAATHQLSTLGEEMVEALPDQEKVKKIVDGARTRKPRKKKKAKK